MRPSGSMRRIMAELRRFALPVLTLALCAAAIAALVTQRTPTEHQSRVTMVVQTSAGANDTETLVRTMIALVNSEVVGEALRERVSSPLPADEIAASLSVERPPGSSVLTVTYVDVDAARSIATAQAILPVFQEQVTRLEAGQAGQLAPNYAIQPWGGGTVLTTEMPSPILRNALIAALLGLIIGVIGAVLYRQQHRLVGGVQDAEEATGLPALALAGPVTTDRKRSLVHPADVMDALTSTLPAALGTRGVPRRTLLIAPESGNRRSAFVVQFARSLAQGDGPVVLVDADLETGRLTRHLGLNKSVGLAECVRGDLTPDEALVFAEEGPAAGLTVLPAGLDLPVRSGSAGHALSQLDAGARVVVDAPIPSRHQSLGVLLRNADAVLVLVTVGTTSVTDASQLTALVGSLSDIPAVTVVLSDRPEQPSSRLATRALVPTEPSRAATLPA
ncbi:hypothetical protein [Modestobacter sp. URMC 112]